MSVLKLGSSRTTLTKLKGAVGKGTGYGLKDND